MPSSQGRPAVERTRCRPPTITTFSSPVTSAFMRSDTCASSSYPGLIHEPHVHGTVAYPVARPNARAREAADRTRASRCGSAAARECAGFAARPRSACTYRPARHAKPAPGREDLANGGRPRRAGYAVEQIATLVSSLGANHDHVRDAAQDDRSNGTVVGSAQSAPTGAQIESNVNRRFCIEHVMDQWS